MDERARNEAEVSRANVDARRQAREEEREEERMRMVQKKTHRPRGEWPAWVIRYAVEASRQVLAFRDARGRPTMRRRTMSELHTTIVDWLGTRYTNPEALSKNTLKTWLRRGEKKKRSGRPRVLTESEEDWLLALLADNDKVNALTARDEFLYLCYKETGNFERRLSVRTVEKLF